jgi:hypothetical protein
MSVAYERLLELAGENVKRHGAQQSDLLCPAHEDHRPSLGLSVRTKGYPGALVRCRAGCRVEDVMAEWWGGALPLAALYDDHWIRRNGHRRIAETYPYVDEAGRLLYETVRYDPKDFRQRRPDGAGDWIWDIKGVRRVLYRLPQVIAAVQAGRLIWLVAGEKDVAALERVGEVATCNPIGESNWLDEYAEPLRGAGVMVVVDRDATGEKYARQVIPSLQRVGADVMAVQARAGKDAHDHFAAGHGIKDFVVREPSREPLEEPKSDPKSELTSVERIRRAIFEDSVGTFDVDAPVREEVPGTGGLLWRGLAHTFFGERGKGKTVTGHIVMVAAAAAGERVLYLDRENGPALTRSLVMGVLDAHEDWPDVTENGHWTGRHWPSFSRDWEPGDYAEAIARRRAYTIVAYDSVREVMAELDGDPNSEQDYSAFVRRLVTPLVRRGICVVTFDNVGHQETGRPKGTGSKLDATPIGYQVRTTERFDPATLGRVTITCKRSRYGDEGREWTARLGHGVFDVPQAMSDNPDEKARREERERFETFARRVVATLQEEAPQGAKKLRRLGGARVQTLIGWLDRIVEEGTWGVVHDVEHGYSLTDDGVPGSAGSTAGGSKEPRRNPSNGNPSQATADNSADSLSGRQPASAHDDPVDGLRL